MHRSLTCLFLLLALLAAGPLAAEEKTLEYGGKALRAELKLADGKALSDGVVVLLHGTMAHNRMEIIRALETAMNERGYSTLAVNLSYNLAQREGMLDCATTHTHRHEDAMDELGQWMGWLRAQGVNKVVLMGHSRGGNQVVWYAAEHDSPQLQAVVAIAPMTWDFNKTTAEYQEQYGKPLAPVLDRAKALADKGKGGETLKGAGMLYCKGADASAASFVSYYRDDARKDTPGLLARLNKPNLVFVGSEDGVVPDLGGKLAGGGKSAHTRIEVIDGADHFFRDLYAEDVADAVAEFLGK